MVQNIKVCLWAVILWLGAGFVMAPAWGQTTVLNQPVQGDGVVTGQATPGSGPISIINLSFDLPLMIGRADAMDALGNFAVPIDTYIRSGDMFVAEDALGNRSIPMIATLPGAPFRF